MKEIREIIRFWEARRNQPLTLATLVRARGSSYRRPGARMLISESGESAGSLSAGCIEEEVVACARELIRSGLPRLLAFDTRRRFGCNGSIEIFVERVSDALMSELRKAMRSRATCQIATVFEDSDAPGSSILHGHAQPGTFLQKIEPVLHLIIVGSGPDAFALQAQGALLGWDVSMIETIPQLRETLDDWSAIIIATHNFGRDCAALRFFLPRGLRYVGLIGPRRRRDEILLDVLDSGAEFTSQLFAPAGLDLAADSPEEIALSVVAEIQSVFTNATAQRLRDRKAPIHDVAAAEWARSAQ